MAFWFIVLSFFFHTLYAQEEATTDATASKDGGGMAFSVFTGPLLPNNIDGITEIQSSWGARLAKTGTWADFYEVGFLISNSKGVELFNYFISIKAEVDTEAFLTQLYIGADYFTYESSKYNPVDDSTTNYDDKVFGAHAGTAFLINYSETIFIRTDLKLNFKPGNSLFIGFGLESRF
jgi:hypothetical protein